MDTATDLSAVVLAGGASTRMGRDKAWLEFEGQSLVVRATKALASIGVRHVFVSGRAGCDYSALNVPVLLDRHPGIGPLGGIERVLHETTAPLVLVLAVDLPRMTSAFLKNLVATCTREVGAVPELDGRLEPLAAIYPKRCHALAAEAIAQSRYAVRDFVAACVAERAVQIHRVAPADASCFTHWTTPTDFAQGTNR